MFKEVKSVFKSKTIWGGALALVGTIVGVTITPDDVGSIAGHLDTIMTAVGALVAIYGRVTADTKIG